MEKSLRNCCKCKSTTIADEAQSIEFSLAFYLKGGVHGSAHVHESKYFFAFARYIWPKPV